MTKQDKIDEVRRILRGVRSQLCDGHPDCAICQAVRDVFAVIGVRK